MLTIPNRWVIGGSTLLLLFSAALPIHGHNDLAASLPPDATLFTFYNLGGDQTVSWNVCGSTSQSTGCYGFGILGSFGNVGALMEGNPSVNLSTNTVARAIYIVDIASGPTGNGVVLYVYKKTDVITLSFDTVTVTLLKTVTLPLVGGSTAICSMAANKGFLFIGTDQSPQAVRVQKSNLTVTQVGGLVPPVNVTAITANQYGYVTVTQGAFGVGENGSYIFGPDGTGVSNDGAAVMLNTVTALSTATLPKFVAQPAQR